MRYSLHPESERDLREAAEFYKERRALPFRRHLSLNSNSRPNCWCSTRYWARCGSMESAVSS